MTNKERVTTALRHRQPDRAPYHVNFTIPAREKMAKFYGDPNFGAKLGNCLTALSTEPADSWREVRPNIWEDQFGVQWDRHVDKDIGVVCNRLVTPENAKTFPLADPDEPSRYAGYDEARRKDPGAFLLAMFGFSLFERAWTLAGMENLLMAMVDDKPFAHTLLDRILEFNLRVIDHACAHDIDAMQFGDDWGQQRGLITGPVLWREFIKPRVAQMYARVKAKGKFVVIHSCGKVDSLFPDLIEIGLDAFNPFQPEVNDVFDAKRRYGDRLSFYGGISTQRLLPYGTPQQVCDEVRRLIEEIGRNGGYIAAPAHDVPGDAKAENVAAMIEVLQNR